MTATDYRTLAGYRAHRVRTDSGATTVPVDGEAQGLDTGGGRWSMWCDTHYEVIASDNQAVLRSYLAHPLEWCEGCQDG